jgi:hypothetical protein
VQPLLLRPLAAVVADSLPTSKAQRIVLSRHPRVHIPLQTLCHLQVVISLSWYRPSVIVHDLQLAQNE